MTAALQEAANRKGKKKATKAHVELGTDR